MREPSGRIYVATKRRVLPFPVGAAGLRGAWLSPLPVMVSGSLLRLAFPRLLGLMGERKGIGT